MRGLVKAAVGLVCVPLAGLAFFCVIAALGNLLFEDRAAAQPLPLFFSVWAAAMFALVWGWMRFEPARGALRHRVVGSAGGAPTAAEPRPAHRGHRRRPGPGTLMGNRGCLHDDDRSPAPPDGGPRLWICCTLTWKDVRRDPMPPGRWTALFFLDEATALAAGHRPCAYCRRGDFLAYAEAWRSAENLARRPWAREWTPAARWRSNRNPPAADPAGPSATCPTVRWSGTTAPSGSSRGGGSCRGQAPGTAGRAPAGPGRAAHPAGVGGGAGGVQRRTPPECRNAVADAVRRARRRTAGPGR